MLSIVTPSLNFLFTDEMAKKHFFNYIMVSEADKSTGQLSVKNAYLVSFYEKQYQHNTGNKKNIMAVLSMPYSVLHGDSG